MVLSGYYITLEDKANNSFTQTNKDESIKKMEDLIQSKNEDELYSSQEDVQTNNHNKNLTAQVLVSEDENYDNDFNESNNDMPEVKPDTNINQNYEMFDGTTNIFNKDMNNTNPKTQRRTSKRSPKSINLSQKSSITTLKNSIPQNPNPVSSKNIVKSLIYPYSPATAVFHPQNPPLPP